MPTISYKKILQEKNNLAPSQLKVLSFKNQNFLYVRDFLSRPLKSSDRGAEVGSANYISKSCKYFVRAKSLSDKYFLPEIDSEDVKPIRPQVFIDYELKKGDILISKDSNIGETVILDKDYADYMPSGAIYKLPLEKNKHYLLAFLKSEIFRDQLDLMVPKGATIRHAKTLFLDCKIPLPNQADSDLIIEYVELLIKSIINKETKLREKNQKILNLIEDELKEKQDKKLFAYKSPSFSDLQKQKRLDTGLYNERYKKQNFLIENYKGGSSDLKDLGYSITRGQNLQVSAIGRSIYSDEYKPGFYRLALSKNFSEWMTVEKYLYVGNKKVLKTLKEGDIVFSCRGDLGRVTVVCRDSDATITNIDNVQITNKKALLSNKIFIASFLNYLREAEYLNQIAITGSGANSFTKYHFRHLRFPNFDIEKQNEIASLYFNPSTVKQLNMKNYLDFLYDWDEKAGVQDIQIQMEAIKEHLAGVIKNIAAGEKINPTFDFLS